MISNCGKDEVGAYSGGQAGDQTGAEYRIMGWYNRPWNCVLRHPDATVRHEISVLAQSAAKNDKIGYDQSQRLTFWNELVKASYDPAKIENPCEADCSSSTAAVVKAAGYRLGNAKLRNVSQTLTTYGMRSALRNAGFDLLTESKYLIGDSYLLAGDILLNDQAHVAINVTNGSRADTSYGKPTNTAPNPSVSQGNVGGSSGNTIPVAVKNGDIVAILPNAVWWSGTSIPAWVKGKRWYVVSVNGKRAVLGRSEDGTYNIMSPISTDNLSVVSTAKPTEPVGNIEGKPSGNLSGSTYVVQKGDTLWSIAVRWCGKGWKYPEIQKANGLTNTIIHVGQVLKLPEKE